MKFLASAVTRFSRQALRQERKGIEKYGHELDPMDPNYDWLLMAEEEQVDGYKYLYAERVKRDTILKDVLVLARLMKEEQNFNKRSEMFQHLRQKLQILSAALRPQREEKKHDN